MNYKDAYLYTFNELTNLIAQIKKIQRTAEYICTVSDGECSISDFLNETENHPNASGNLEASSENT